LFAVDAIAPPTTGPRPTPRPLTPDQAPIARPRRSAGTPEVSSVSDRRVTITQLWVQSEYCSKQSDALKITQDDGTNVTPRTQAKTRRLNRADKREANRARILAAARKVFGARGFHAATIEEIAEEAGLSNGAIYYNFDSKGDLFLALLEERSDERIRHMRHTLAKASLADARDLALDQEARDATRSLKESGEWRLLLLEFSAHAARTPSLAPKLQAHKRRLRAALAELLDRRLSTRGASPPIPVDQLALAAIGLSNGLAIEELADPGSVPDELLGDLLALLVKPPS
jgi:AcrR family transcriptional regulator